MRRILLLALGASSFAAPVLAQQPLAQQQPAPPAPPARGGGMMQRMDTNGDGVVTRAEALAEAERRFKAQDADNNGIITAAERDAWMAQMRGGARGGGFGGRGGGGGDQGTQTRAEFVERAGMRFDRMDANHDGKLDGSELQMRGGRGRRGDMGPPPPTPPVAPPPSN